MTRLWREVQTELTAERIAGADPESWHDYMMVTGLHIRHIDKVTLASLIRKPPREIEIITLALRWEIWERDDFTCLICGSRRFLTIDHFYPRSRGGPTIKENLVTLCKSCNSRKSAKIYKR